MHQPGDAAQAFGGTARVIDARYVYPFLVHVPFEPMNPTRAAHRGALHFNLSDNSVTRLGKPACRPHCNTTYAATGKRIRTPPISLDLA